MELRTLAPRYMQPKPSFGYYVQTSAILSPQKGKGNEKKNASGNWRVRDGTGERFTATSYNKIHWNKISQDTLE